MKEKINKLLERRAALMAEVEKPETDEKRFAELRAEIAKIDFAIEDAEKQLAKEEREEEERAARKPNSDPAPETRGKGITLFNGATENAADLTKPELLRHAKTALGKQIRMQLQDVKIDLTANEKRAIGVAITTTATEFTAVTASKDGVNNGGVFIPQNVLYDLLEMDDPDSPFLRDVNPTHIKGALIFPYVVESNNGTGKGKKETVAANSRAIKWDKLSLAQGNYPLTIEVTMELLGLTDEEFVDYLLADLANEINLLLGDEVLYGTGKDECIEGATVGAIAGDPYESGNAPAAIKAGLLALSRRARKGAKIYVSRSLSLDLAFEKDENGRYIYPIYNNDGITSIATIPMEVDEGLHDGDFLIGNARNYKLNFTKPTEIYAELHGKTRVIEYTAHLMVAGKAAPKKFYYGSQKAATPDNGND